MCSKNLAFCLEITTAIYHISKEESTRYCDLLTFSADPTYFHVENIALGFIGCFIGGLSVSIVGIIFSYSLVFKSLYEVYKCDLNISQKATITETIKKGSEVNDALRHIIYWILGIIGFGSIIIGFYLVLTTWSYYHYIILKAVLLFILIGIVPAIMSIIFWLLVYPGAPLNKLLSIYHTVLNNKTANATPSNGDKQANQNCATIKQQ